MGAVDAHQHHDHDVHEGHHVHDHHGHDHHDEPMTAEEAMRSLLLLGEVALSANDYESAVEAYASAVKLGPDETAFYNLGSLYARGLGVGRNYVEAARLFHQAELLGNARAGKLCAKCMFDYLHEGLDDKTPTDLYAMMAWFVSTVYPEADDAKQEVNRGLVAVGGTLLNAGEHAGAAKVFRAAAEFGADGAAQYYLAVLYNAGTGVEQNDLAALYWLDCAVDNGAEEALADRDGMLDAYQQALSPAEFRGMLEQLAASCEAGTPDIPADPAKAARWRS